MALKNPPDYPDGMLTPDQRRQWLLDKISRLRMWSRGDNIAPHKPLLFLYALGRYAAGDRTFPYEQVDRALTRLLREFGPGSAKAIHTNYPFCRLPNDGLWEVKTDRAVGMRESGGDWPKSELLRVNAKGSFPDDVASVAIRSLSLHRGHCSRHWIYRRAVKLRAERTRSERGPRVKLTWPSV